MKESKKILNGVIDRYEENHVIICDADGNITDFIYDTPDFIPEGTAVIVSISESGSIELTVDTKKNDQLKTNINNKFRELLNKNKNN